MPIARTGQSLTDTDGYTYVLTGLIRAGAQAEAWHAVTANTECKAVVVRITPGDQGYPRAPISRGTTLSNALGSGWMRPIAIGTRHAESGFSNGSGTTHAEPVTFTVYPRAAGGDLQQYVEEFGRLTDHTKATRIVARIADAIAQAHASGVYHNDLKPDNIVLEVPESSDPVPRIIDLGLGRGDGDAGRAAGRSPGFAPPEAIRGQGFNADRPALPGAADVYGLGAVLFYLLTAQPPNGRTPDEAASRTAAGSSQVNRQLQSKALADACAPDAVSAAVLRALSDDPVDRPHKAAEFAIVLWSAIAQQSHINWRAWSRVGAAGLALFVVGAVVGGLSITSWRSAEQRETLVRAESAEGERDELVNAMDAMTRWRQRFESEQVNRVRSQRWDWGEAASVDNFPSVLMISEMLRDERVIFSDEADLRTLVAGRADSAQIILTEAMFNDEQDHIFNLLLELCVAAWVYQDGEAHRAVTILDGLVPRLEARLLPDDPYVLGAHQLLDYATVTAAGGVPTVLREGEPWVMQLVSNQVRDPNIEYPVWAEPPASALVGIRMDEMPEIDQMRRVYTDDVRARRNAVDRAMAEGHPALNDSMTLSQAWRALQAHKTGDQTKAEPEPTQEAITTSTTNDPGPVPGASPPPP